MPRTEQIRVRVSPEEHAAIRRRAERDGRSVSGYLRRLGVAPERERVERVERHVAQERA